MVTRLRNRMTSACGEDFLGRMNRRKTRTPEQNDDANSESLKTQALQNFLAVNNKQKINKKQHVRHIASRFICKRFSNVLAAS